MERRITSTTGSTYRSGAPRASIRPPVRQAKSSLARHGPTAPRLDRSGAISPAESVSSAATAATTGTKRKEREFEADESGESTKINVVVRCRGRNQREVKENSTVVVRTDGTKGSIVELSMGPNALSNKTYNFDRVFSPAADQSMVFDEVVKPILDEVISGYNCTIFAYGQTGSGKTHTMLGPDFQRASTHKCLSPDTMVRTTEGDIPIRDVTIGTRLFGIDGLPVLCTAVDNIKTSSTMRTIKHRAWNSKSTETSFECTSDHVLVLQAWGLRPILTNQKKEKEKRRVVWATRCDRTELLQEVTDLQWDDIVYRLYAEVRHKLGRRSTDSEAHEHIDKGLDEFMAELSLDSLSSPAEPASDSPFGLALQLFKSSVPAAELSTLDNDALIPLLRERLHVCMRELLERIMPEQDEIPDNDEPDLIVDLDDFGKAPDEHISPPHKFRKLLFPSSIRASDPSWRASSALPSSSPAKQNEDQPETQPETQPDSQASSFADTLQMVRKEDHLQKFAAVRNQLRSSCTHAGGPCKAFKMISVNFATQDQAELALELLSGDHYRVVDPYAVRNGDFFTMTVDEYMASCQGGLPMKKKSLKLFRAPTRSIPSPVTTNLPVDPYFLGFWLGDGSKDSATITSSDMEIKLYLQAMVDRLNKTRPATAKPIHLNEHVKVRAGDTWNIHGRTGIHKMTTYSWTIAAPNARGSAWFNPVRTGLQDLGFLGGDKRVGVPDEYMNADEDTRLAVLAGLLESDGTYAGDGNGGTYVFTQATEEHKKIVEDARKLALSCGIECSPIYESKNDIGSTKFSIHLKKGSERFQHHLLLPRKKMGTAKFSDRVNTQAHPFEVSGHHAGEYRAIEVSGGLFQLADHTVVHNCDSMSGDMTEQFGMMSDAAGIIPRVLNALFNKLEAEDTESVVRCSFIELYNEELRDLLSADDGKLKIYDDNSRKGHATTVVQGMEERHITNATDGLKWLEQGSVRRQVAATKCNDLSSRSHTVFTININIKRTAEDGEEYLSAGKLNLVDLAGSENIQRSGAENKRAAEAGLINKSLLTLGRVINALVDRSQHIPYRESKLTRLLQDSLGGRTKTCIIATISPAKSNLEETISTLDYAFRAKNIKNKPQVNPMINKKTLLREFSAEIEKLKSELITTRQRNGVYLSNEDYEEITAQNESRRILTDEQAAKIETLEHNLRNKVQDLFTLNSSFMGLKKDHESTKAQLDETKDVLDQTELVLAATRKMLAEETHIRKAHQQTEEKLTALGGELLTTLKKTVEDVGGLRAKNKRKSDLQMLNRSTWSMSQSQVADVTELVEGRIQAFRTGQEEHIAQVSRRMGHFVTEELSRLTATQQFLDEHLAHFAESKKELLEQKEKSKDAMDNVLEEIKVVRDSIKERVGESLQAIAAAAERIAADVLSELDTFHNQLHTSYSSLGKDFKTLFEDMVRHMNAQNMESDRLRRQLESTGDDMVQSNEAISARIQEVVEQERNQAAEERKQLLSQIASLITHQATQQETRLAGKAALIQKSVLETSSTFQEGMTEFSTGMDAWNEKEVELVGEVNKSRTAMKKKMKDDWTAADETSTKIQNTAKSVHQETVRVVDEQMKDLDVQMRDLDDFVTRARAENAEHHKQHAASVEGLSSTVGDSFSNISQHFVETYDRVRDLGEEMDTAAKTLTGTLPPLEESICRPLSNLREDINNTVLREYVPTGETPKKLTYEYPTALPRTEPHEVLLAELQEDVPQPTPTKLAISTTTTTVPTVFHDQDQVHSHDEQQDHDLDMLPAITTTLPDSPPPQPRPLDMSLREMNPNLTTGSVVLFDPNASTMSMPPPASENKTLPLFKRSVSGISKPVARTTRRRGHAADTLGEGRENVPPAGSGMGIGGSRRKSPRLN